MIGDCRRKHVSCLPPSINYDVIKKVMDEALITKDYSHAARSVCACSLVQCTWSPYVYTYGIERKKCNTFHGTAVPHLEFHLWNSNPAREFQAGVPQILSVESTSGISTCESMEYPCGVHSKHMFHGRSMECVQLSPSLH